MKLTSMRCPSCGAEIQIPEGKPFFFCTFCGTQIHVEDGTIRVEITKNVNIENRYVDVARLRQLELQEQERLRIEQQREEEKRQAAELEEAEQKKEKAKRKKWILACVIWLVGYTIAYFVMITQDWALGSRVALIIFLFFPIVLGATMPGSFFASENVPSKGKRMGCGFALSFAYLIVLNLIARYIMDL